MPRGAITRAEAADIAFLFLATAAAIGFAFAAGNYWTAELVTSALGAFPSEGGKGFTANFGVGASFAVAVLTGAVATLYLIALFALRAGSVLCWERIAGYILLLPFTLMLLRILWVQVFRR